MDNINMARQSRQSATPKSNKRRSKPMVAKAGATRRRTPYKNGGKVDK